MDPQGFTFLVLAPTTSAVYEKLSFPQTTRTNPPEITTEIASAAATPSPNLGEPQSPNVPITGPGIAVPGSQPAMDGVAMVGVDVTATVQRFREGRADSMGSERSGSGSEGGEGGRGGLRFLRLGPIHGSNDVEGLGMGSWS